MSSMRVFQNIKGWYGRVQATRPRNACTEAPPDHDATASPAGFWH